MYMSQGRKKDEANDLTIKLKHLINETATMTSSYFFRASFFLRVISTQLFKYTNSLPFIGFFNF